MRQEPVLENGGLSPRGSHNWGCFKLQPGFQRSCRPAPRPFLWRSPWVLKRVLPAGLAHCSGDTAASRGRGVLPGARPRPQAALEVEAADLLLGLLSPFPSATGSLPSQAQCPRRERPGQQAPRVAGILTVSGESSLWVLGPTEP